ncbi:hypothetical protein ASG88_11125 [Nocardioides sp. Soil777]|uniref:hypothetical protein n=1 Tax=Nocardioides sp. Soil777 TaxID=1736409 RepID=UPI000703070F|nr:hypothetical protein [Nocardioides sp. Soil777]KRF00946.1 hypothetical protein ASG88_11125 [Nocardioides sp. Soil777]
MVILGLLLIILGAIAILSAIFVSEGSGELLGIDMSSLEIFLVGVAAGAAVLWGYSILKWGTRRGLAHRKERKELNKLNQKLDRVEAEKREDNPTTPDERV